MLNKYSCQVSEKLVLEQKTDNLTTKRFFDTAWKMALKERARGD